MKEKTVSLYTLGCRTNQSETASIQGKFERNGYTIVDIDKPSDISVINTCTVTEKADTDCRKMINKLRRVNPGVKIALIGCQAELQRERLSKLPNVKWIIGTEKKLDVQAIINHAPNNNSPEIVLPEISKHSFNLSAQSINTKNTRANIKIQDGCDYFCSYCEVPYARGRARSRNFQDIVKEAKYLSKSGFKELVITGINVGTYNNENKGLLDVIKALQQIEDIKRIRISSIEFKTIPSELLNLMAKRTKLCRHLHLPLQNADDKILKYMNRKYNFAEFRDFAQKACGTVPDICLGSDVIVGFPYETVAIFNESLKKIRSLPLHYLHVFSYSKRNMAKSKDYPNQVPRSEISERSNALRKLSLQKKRSFLKSMVGTTHEVLFEQKKAGYWSGLTDNYIRVKVKSDFNLSNVFGEIKSVKLNAQNIIGNFVKTAL